MTPARVYDFGPVRVILPPVDASIHGGTYLPRYLQAGGKISREEADCRVREARLRRRLGRSQRRRARRHPQGR